MYTEHIHKIFMCVFHLTMTMMITIIINATIYYCIHHLHVAIYTCRHCDARCNWCRWLIGRWLVGWSRGCIVAKQLDGWYSGWPWPVTHCVRRGSNFEQW